MPNHSRLMVVLSTGKRPEPPAAFDLSAFPEATFEPPLAKPKLLAGGRLPQPPAAWLDSGDLVFDPPRSKPKVLGSGRLPRPPPAWEHDPTCEFEPPLDADAGDPVEEDDEEESVGSPQAARVAPPPVEVPAASTSMTSIVSPEPSAKASKFEEGRRLVGEDGAQWECVVGTDFAHQWRRCEGQRTDEGGEGNDESRPSDADAMDVSGLEEKQTVLALGRGPSGSRDWFRARIDKFRPSFPPIVITYTATHPGGETHPLSLPEPRVAYVHKGCLKSLETPPESADGDAPAPAPD